jgi:hypothetical protein
VTVIPATSQIDNDTLASLEKSGVDMLNKQMEKMLEAEPPPAELDRTYIEKYFSDFANSFNFSLDRRMVLIRNFTPSANVSNVFQEGDVEELVASVDLRTATFAFLKVPVRVNADFQKLPLDSVTVTVTYTRKRIDGSGREQVRDSFNFTSGSAISTFLAYANTLADVAYDWSATVHYEGSHDPYTITKTGAKDDFLVVDVGQLGMIAVDVGLGLVNFDKFPAARVSFRYQSRALGRTIEGDVLLTEQTPNNTWTEVVGEEAGDYEYKVDWLKADGTILEGDWETSTSSQLRLVSPTPDRMEVVVLCTGNFSDKTDDQISQVGVALRYQDPANDYEVDGHVTFTSEKQQQPWAVDLRNPALRTYQYRYTIVYTDGMVKSFPAADDQWLDGQPGFITVGEKYTLEVGIYPTLLTYPDNAKLVEVDLTYDDEANGIHRVGSFVFSKDANQNVMKTWRIRGVEGGPTTYRYVIRYFSADGSIVSTQEAEHEGETLVIPPAAAPAPAPVPH